MRNHLSLVGYEEVRGYEIGSLQIKPSGSGDENELARSERQALYQLCITFLGLTVFVSF